MFTKVMVPVDLAHADGLEKALAVAADLSQRHGAEAVLVGVTPSSPTEIASSPEAFGERLSRFAADRSAALGAAFGSRVEVSHDVAVDLGVCLSRAADAIGADLIVMASHTPGLAEYVFASNAGYLAAHSTLSVFVVR